MGTPVRQDGRSFLNLPQNVQQNIFQNILVVVHPLYIFQEPGSEIIEVFAPDKPRRWISLLLGSRQLHDKAAETFYGANHFVMMDTEARQTRLIQSFLNRIGPASAGHLRHLSINFPVADQRDEGNDTILKEDDACSLRLLQKNCGRLMTLELIVQARNAADLALSSQGGEIPARLRKFLSKVDEQVRAIPSLTKLVVKWYAKPASIELADEMRQLGWTVVKGK